MRSLPRTPAITWAIVGLAVVALSAWLAAGRVAPAQADTPPATAASAPEDPAVAARVKTLESELRCLVCQAQSVAESDSEFSQDVRREVNRMVSEGRSDADIKDFLVQRYGDFILFKPPVKSITLLLWAGPMMLLVIGAVTLMVVVARRRGSTALSEEDHRRAEALLASADSKGKGEA